MLATRLVTMCGAIVNLLRDLGTKEIFRKLMSLNQVDVGRACQGESGEMKSKSRIFVSDLRPTVHCDCVVPGDVAILQQPGGTPTVKA